METELRILQKLNSIANLPTLPVVMHKISAAVRDPKTDARSLAVIMEDDPAIMARVLKIVNSAFYAGAFPVTTVQQAVARMGLRAIHNIALSTAVFSAFGKSEDNTFDRKEFWRHSICVGIGACLLADRAASRLTRPYPRDSLHLAGLLHDIGKIVLDQYFHDEFLAALARSRASAVSFRQAEEEAFRADHAQIGAWLGAKWNLTDELTQVVRWHHDPAGAGENRREINMLIHVSNCICNRHGIGDGGDTTAPDFVAEPWWRLGLAEKEDAPAIAEAIRKESEKSEILLSLAEGA